MPSCLAGLVIVNWAGVVELAGILAGAFTTAACLLLFTRGRGGVPPPWAALLPYGMVLGLVVVIRGLSLLGVPISAWTLTIGGVGFRPLTSPGLALAATAVVLGYGRPTKGIPSGQWRSALTSPCSHWADLR